MMVVTHVAKTLATERLGKSTAKDFGNSIVTFTPAIENSANSPVAVAHHAEARGQDVSLPVYSADS
jgi:hypothetical protein